MTVIIITIFVIDVHIGFIGKLKKLIIHVATYLKQRLFAIRRNILLLYMNTNIKNQKKIITVDIECCVVNVIEHTNKNVKAVNIQISVGYMWRSTGEDVWHATTGAHSQMEKVPFNENFKYYFGLDCMKRFARDLLEIEDDKITMTTKDDTYH